MKNLANIISLKIAFAFFSVFPLLSSSAFGLVKDENLFLDTKNSVFSCKLAGGRLVLKYFGSKDGLEKLAPKRRQGIEDSVLTASGDSLYFYEPAMQVVHSDGNVALDLRCQKLEKEGNLTRFTFKDHAYDFYIILNIQRDVENDVFTFWTEALNKEANNVTLQRFASVSATFKAKDYYITHFGGGYGREMRPTEEKLTRGLKTIYSRLTSRAHREMFPGFVLSLDNPKSENASETFIGTLAWPGNFNFTFEVDNDGYMRMIAGENIMAFPYTLKSGEKFVSPKFIVANSSKGTGIASRNLHNHTRKHILRDAKAPRPVLLNNWEATYCNFDEAKLVSLFEAAKDLNIDVFLLDDGWFGNKHPRNKDNAGLGDWQVNKTKLPNGLNYLCKEAKKRNFGFGIWLEPEMVNPRSELYENHPDWILSTPKRDRKTFRNQFILDITQPEVFDFEWSIFENTLRGTTIQYVKWDCNRAAEQLGSDKAQFAHNLAHNYNVKLLELMKKFSKNFPKTKAMLCSGGGGRTDLESLKYFTSFWPSDNTNPESRAYMQWNYSYFFPSSAISSHVTRMGNKSFKVAVDIALSGAFGFDLDITKCSEADLKYLSESAALYKKVIQPISLDGDLYRLVSPFENPRSALSYVSKDKKKAVLFIYQLKRGSADDVVKLEGLNPSAKYKLEEASLRENEKGRFQNSGVILTGEELMQTGIKTSQDSENQTCVILLTAQ